MSCNRISRFAVMSPLKHAAPRLMQPGPLLCIISVPIGTFQRPPGAGDRGCDRKLQLGHATQGSVCPADEHRGAQSAWEEGPR